MRRAVLVLTLLALSGCFYADPGRIDSPPRDCILLTSGAGINPADAKYMGEQLLEGSYEKHLTDTFLLSLPPADQARFKTEVKQPDAWLDGKWSRKDWWADHMYQMWWRSEDDDNPYPHD